MSNMDRNPFGHKESCATANAQLANLVRLAQRAWYSADPKIKYHERREYRQYRDDSEWYQVKENEIYAHTIEVNRLENDGRIFRITIQTYDKRPAGPSSEPLSEIPPNGRHVGNNYRLFGENFTTSNPSGTRFLHRCADASVKKLIVFPHVEPSGYPRLSTSLAVYSSEWSDFFEETEGSLKQRLWEAFKRNKNVNNGIAFGHLKQLIALQEQNLRGLRVYVEKDSHLLKWYEYEPNSGEYFREIKEGLFKVIAIEEYNRDPRSRTLYRAASIPSQASLSHRKSGIYAVREHSEVSSRYRF